MKLIKLLLECHRLLLAAADEARASELSGSKAFEEIVEAGEGVASALTRLRMEGRLDPETSELVEREMERAVTRLNT